MKYGTAVLLSTLLFFTVGIHSQGVCQNDGKEIGGVHQKCDCPKGFKGYDCSEKVTVCEINPCRHSAVCVENNNGTFTCICEEGYDGLLCEKKVAPCNKVPCKNGGKCSDDGLKCFKCQCLKGFKGFDCSEKVLPCEASPCQNGGTCFNKVNGRFKCVCTIGYTGTVCTHKDSLLNSRVLEGNKLWIDLLKRWLPSPGRRNLSVELCYRASTHGWSAITFHRRCDFKGATIVLIKADVSVFGGYAGKSWGGPTGYKRADSSFIFSLRNKANLSPFKSIVYRNFANSMYTKSNSGPTFGGGHDIFVANQATFKTSSYTNFGFTYRPPIGYTYSSTKARNLLAGNYNFRPEEVEVYCFLV